MKADRHPDYRPEFPESFNWSKLDSIKLCDLALELANETKICLRDNRRDLVPGLRFALNRIAERGEV